MNTPEIITELEPGQVFVFGSNRDGMHMAGAAKVAMERFGALWGRGEGLQGRSYAIPTMEGIDALGAAADRFVGFASVHPELTFLVTKLGTGIAGHRVEDVAPFFADGPSNVILPVEFEAVPYELGADETACPTVRALDGEQ